MGRLFQLNAYVTFSLLLLLWHLKPVQAQAQTQFALNMFTQLSLLKPNQNIIFSPFSIQSCAAMARIGAEGKTAAEMERSLGLVSSDPQEIAESFHQAITYYENKYILSFANRIYVMKGLELRDEFNLLLKEQFRSPAENLDFAQSVQAAATINGWVEKKTNHLIKDLIKPNDLNGDTRIVLVNAIHFKGNWLHPFSNDTTSKKPFYVNKAHGVDVPMMYVKKKFRYADLPDLDAKALELPYENSDLVMIVLLPNSRTGLAELEKKLLSMPLATITQSMSSKQVLVELPKFKVEFEIELKDAFEKLGMSRMFSKDAEFGKMLKSPEHLEISKIILKAIINVDENGTEAAAATALKWDFYSMPIGLVHFNADHPFFFYITNSHGQVFFAGKLLRP